jgi:hypothetical protein
MKFTVIELVQDILSAMDSDEVNSINDTVESQQVARIIKNCYNDLVSTIEFPDSYSLLQLDPSLSPDQPVVMYIPQSVENVEWIKYNKEGLPTSGSATAHSWTTPDGITIYFGTEEAAFGSAPTGSAYQQFTDITYLPRERFLQQIQAFNNSQDNIVDYTLLENGVNIPLLCRNDKSPDYWTIFNNRTIVFDSYDASVDTTLQASKTMCYGKLAHNFTMTDNWEIPLDSKYSSLLFNEAKATCFAELKQMPNARAEKMARVAKIKSQKQKKAAPFGEPAIDDNPNYGRRTVPNHYRTGYYK